MSKIAPGFTYEGIDAPVEVRTHARARNLKLDIRRHPRAVIVTLPVECDLSQADNLIMRNIDWVREYLDRIPKPVPFHDGAMVPLRGQIHRLVFAGEHQTGVVVQRASYKDDVCGSGVEGNQGVPELHVGGPVEHAPRRFLDFLYEEVWWDFSVCIIKHAQKLDVPAPCITIRDQKTCWASCSTIGALSVSWRLILAPPFVLDYVVAHEIAHLVEMNHGPKFWALVGNMMPRVQEAKDWLECHGPDLHRYGPAKRKSSYAPPRRLRRAGQ